MDSGYTHIGIDKQLVKDKRIQTRPINFSFEVFNANRIRNGEVTKVALLEISKQNKEWRGDQGGTSRNQNKQIQRTAGSHSDRFKQNKYIFGT